MASAGTRGWDGVHRGWIFVTVSASAFLPLAGFSGLSKGAGQGSTPKICVYVSSLFQVHPPIDEHHRRWRKGKGWRWPENGKGRVS
ncbi:hypothetical protein L6452_23805 [Arctium lappa]|uniref:Uncharacterized protein n=1 Tax=Arctium lappa TaxID=4217 RepID=A0ACB9A9K5_ARCLA|nr:hypothetical protein L6452_23805 [Arctium lappa]